MFKTEVLFSLYLENLSDSCKLFVNTLFFRLIQISVFMLTGKWGVTYHNQAHYHEAIVKSFSISFVLYILHAALMNVI